MMERNPYFVQVADLEKEDLGNFLCQTTAFDQTTPEGPRCIIIRGERQTFKRLPKTGAIVFAVKTSLRPLTHLNDDELGAFLEEFQSWPKEVAMYKGRDWWGECATRYCLERLQGRSE